MSIHRQTHRPRSCSPTSRAFCSGRFSPGDPERVARIIARIMALPEDQVGAAAGRGLRRVRRAAPADPRALSGTLRAGPRARCRPTRNSPKQRRLLIGAYFLAEYSLESAALFNPSIVPHPDQSGLPPGALRFILSLRATGEGHISSITFRTGIIHADQRHRGPARRRAFCTEPRQIPNPRVREGAVRAQARGTGLDGRIHAPGAAQTRGVVHAGRTSRQPRRPSSSACRMA